MNGVAWTVLRHFNCGTMSNEYRLDSSFVVKNMCSELSHSLEITHLSIILESKSLPRMQGVLSLYFTVENIAHINFAIFSLQMNNFHRPKELSSGLVVKNLWIY